MMLQNFVATMNAILIFEFQTFRQTLLLLIQVHMFHAYILG